MSLGIGIGLPFRRGGGYIFSDIAKALFDRLSGEETKDDKIILDKFARDLSTYGIVAKADVVYDFETFTANNTLLNIVKNAHNATKIANPIHTKGKGWKGDKTSAGLNSNFNATTAEKATEIDFSFGAFFHNLYGLNLPSIGLRTDSTHNYYLLEQDTSNKRRISTGGSVSTLTEVSLLDSALIMVNVSGTDVSIYRNGKLFTAPATRTSTFLNLVFYLLCYNNNGTAASFTDRAITDVYFGKALTATEHYNYYKAIMSKQLNINSKRVNTSAFLSGFNKTSKPLHKLMVVGDSIMANETGGTIPVGYDEGEKYRPMRLSVNNIARRIYDKLSWNRATHVRLDADEWTKSGTWTAITNERIVFEPSYSNGKYHQSTVANSYVEITIPDGVSNFAFICMRDANFDTLTVTLNGGSIAAYGNSTVNCNRTRLTANEIGNPYHTEQYIGLPAGDNVIRIAKGNNTNVAAIWGGFYWNGNTLMVYNVAHGGKTFRRLYNDFMTGDITENNADAIVFEMPIINELSQADAYDNSFSYFRNIINNTFAGKDYLLFDPHPIGISPITEENSYLNYSNPNMEQTCWVMRSYIYQKDLPYINIFQYFKEYIESLGYTIEGGQSGTLFTSDGVHLNTAGNDKMWEFINDLFVLP